MVARLQVVLWVLLVVMMINDMVVTHASTLVFQLGLLLLLLLGLGEDGLYDGVDGMICLELCILSCCVVSDGSRHGMVRTDTTSRMCIGILINTGTRVGRVLG